MIPALYFEDEYNNIDQLLPSERFSRGTLISAHIADLHFPVSNIGPEMQFSILDEQFIQKINNLPKLDLVTVLGDLYDHKVLASSDAALYASMFIGKVIEICKRKNATLIIIQGTLSHDSNQLKLYYHYMHDPSIDVRIVTRVQFEYVKNMKILCIPELYGVEESLYKHFLSGSGFYDMALMHGTIQGAVFGDNVGTGRLFRIEDFMNCRGPILSGHVHKPDCFNHDFYYCGSPYAWSFADDHRKGFILCALNLDTFKYYIDWEEIKSFVYQTITIDEIVNHDPQTTITYIDKLKANGIDYIRIQFDTQISKIERMILNNNYRDNEYVKLQFPNTEEEIYRKKQEEKLDEDIEKYKFIIDPKISDEEKFCIYVNMLKGEDGYLTVDKLRALLEDTI